LVIRDAADNTDYFRVLSETGKEGETYIKGNVGIGTTAPGHQLELSTDDADKLTTPHWTNPSDESLKDDITDLTDALSTILRLRGRTFTFKDKALRPGKYAGFVAQEVESVIPEWVRTRDDGLKTLTIGNDTALFVEAFREVTQRLELLEERLG
jgi:hypothetical protein